MSKTIEEIKNEVAIGVGYKNYRDVEDWNSECMIIDEVAQRYAQSQTQELKEQNAELVEMLDKARYELLMYKKNYGLSSKLADEITELLTKYNHLNKI